MKNTIGVGSFVRLEEIEHGYELEAAAVMEIDVRRGILLSWGTRQDCWFDTNGVSPSGLTRIDPIDFERIDWS